MGLDLLHPYIRTLVIKDFNWAERDGQWYIKDQPLGEGMVDFAAYFERVEHMGLSGPISLHLEYEVAEDSAAPAERQRKTLAAMQRDVQTLRAMLETAGL